MTLSLIGDITCCVYATIVTMWLLLDIISPNLIPDFYFDIMENFYG